MECISTNAIFDPLDICNIYACYTADISRSDLANTHLAHTHRTFKARKFLLLCDLGRSWMAARNAIARGDSAISEAMNLSQSLIRSGKSKAHALATRDAHVPFRSVLFFCGIFGTANWNG